jgi:hypothetical protein
MSKNSSFPPLLPTAYQCSMPTHSFLQGKDLLVPLAANVTLFTCENKEMCYNVTHQLTCSLLNTTSPKACSFDWKSVPLTKATALSSLGSASLFAAFANGYYNIYWRPRIEEANLPLLQSLMRERFPTQPPSVRLIILDTTSRVSFFQQNRKTVRWLEDVMLGTTSRVYDFALHNIVGISTGQNIPQLIHGCQPSTKRLNDHTLNCGHGNSLIRYFAENGYVTAYFSQFNMSTEAIYEFGTHCFCGHPFAASKQQTCKTGENDGEMYQLQSPIPSKRCFAGKLGAQHLFDAQQSFENTFPSHPTLSVLHVMMSHTPFLNGAPQVRAALGHQIWLFITFSFHFFLLAGCCPH